MSTIFGILSKGEKQIGDKEFDKLLKALSCWQPDNRYSWFNEDIALGNLLMNTTPQSKNEHLSSFYSDSQCIIISDSRLDYRRNLVEDFGEDWDEFKNYPDNYLILKSYLKWKEGCVNHLFGDFAFAIWDDKNKHLFCARDHFGIRPLYYCDQPDYFVFSTDPMVFKSIPGINIQITDEYILDSICTIIADRYSSAYANIFKLEPAHFINIDSNRALLKSKYWDLKINQDYQNLDEANAIIGLRERFIDSVRNKTISFVPMGLELSGGLDSSSIASCLSEFHIDLDSPICGFIHTMSKDQKLKPMGYIDVVEMCNKVFSTSPFLKLYGISGENLPSGRSAIVNYLELIQRPVNQGFALLSDLLYEKAQEQGVRILFSGYGGDQGVTQSGIFYLQELASMKNWSKLKHELKKDAEKTGSKYLRRFIRYFVLSYVPQIGIIKKRLTFSPNDFDNRRWKVVAVNRDNARNLDFRSRYFKAVKRPDFQSNRELQYYTITKSNFESERLENSYYSARKRRIEYRYPFLDVKLIEYFYSLKSELKYKDGTRRYLFRLAMEGILDDRIRKIPRKFGFAIPNSAQRVLQDEEWLKEIIMDGKSMNNFHYVDYDQLLWVISILKDPMAKKSKDVPTLVFLTAFSVLLLQKWQREGKIDIGIKY